MKHVAAVRGRPSDAARWSWISPKGRLVDYKRDAWTIPMDDAKRLAAEWAKKCGGWCFEVIAETRA
jgi:hypothetical protein